ncbi:uncharacterized protein METZ01_LOCUS443291 [marine metagenome]|uniref:Uncharacterized protein n=1 Tax=marine metagenome TaxID=408172 RepID=A0A382Z4K6_9ZZZZ
MAHESRTIVYNVGTGEHLGGSHFSRRVLGVVEDLEVEKILDGR